MDFGISRIGLYPKKFIPYEQMEDGFFQFLLGLSDSGYASIFPKQGIASGCILGSSVADTFTISTPAKFISKTLFGTRVFQADSGEPYVFDDIPFENGLGVDYHVGFKHLELPVNPVANVRTGKIEFDKVKQTVGEMDLPDSVSDLGGDQLKIVVNTVLKSLTPNEASHAGRLCQVWLKFPVSPLLAVETLTVQWDGTDNYVVASYMGQDVPSTAAGDYVAALEGPTWTKDAGMATDPDYTYIGVVTGAGTGVVPTVFDISGQYHYPSSPGVAINDLWTIYQDLYTTPHFDGDGLPNLDTPVQTMLALEHYDHDTLTPGRHGDIGPDTINMHIQTGLQFTIQAFDVADKLNEKIQIKDNTGTVVAWVNGGGDAQFQDLHVMGTEYIHESEIIDGDFTVLGNLTAGDDNTVDRMYGHLLRADFDKDVYVGQDLHVLRHSYLGDDALDRVQVAGAFQNQVRFLNDIRLNAPSPSVDYAIIQALSNALDFSTSDADMFYFQFVNAGVGGSTISGQHTSLSGNSTWTSTNPSLSLGGTNPFTFIKSSDVLLQINSAYAVADTTLQLINSDVGMVMHLNVEGNIQTGNKLWSSGTLALDDSNLLGPKPLPLSGSGAFNQTYNGSATTLIGMLNECLSSGSLDWNYDSGGAGLGREIVADAKAVALNRKSHAVTITTTYSPVMMTYYANITGGDDWGRFNGAPSSWIVVQVTGSTLGSNGWYVATPTSSIVAAFGTDPPGGVEVGISATWYEISGLVTGQPDYAYNLESFVDTAKVVRSISVASNGSASWGIDPNSLSGTIYATEQLTWEFFGTKPLFNIYDTTGGIRQRALITFDNPNLLLKDNAAVTSIGYDFTNKTLDGKSVTRAINFQNPVDVQDLVTLNYIQNGGALSWSSSFGLVFGADKKFLTGTSFRVTASRLNHQGVVRYSTSAYDVTITNTYNPSANPPVWGRRSGEALANGWWYIYLTTDSIPYGSIGTYGVAISMSNPDSLTLTHPLQPTWRWIGSLLVSGGLLVSWSSGGFGVTFWQSARPLKTITSTEQWFSLVDSVPVTARRMLVRYDGNTNSPNAYIQFRLDDAPIGSNQFIFYTMTHTADYFLCSVNNVVGQGIYATYSGGFVSNPVFGGGGYFEDINNAIS